MFQPLVLSPFSNGRIPANRSVRLLTDKQPSLWLVAASALESRDILEPISNFQLTSRTQSGRYSVGDAYWMRSCDNGNYVGYCVANVQCVNFGSNKRYFDVVRLFLVVCAVGNGLMRTLADSERNTLPRGWVRQAVMGVLRWKELPGGRNDTLQKGATLQVNKLLISFDVRW